MNSKNPSLSVLQIHVDEYRSWLSCPLSQVVSERETELRNAQEQSSKLQTELNRLRQDLQEKTSQEEGMRQQMSEKEEKTRKAFLMAKQKISQLMGKKKHMNL